MQYLLTTHWSSLKHFEQIEVNPSLLGYMHMKENITVFYGNLCLNVGLNYKFQCHMKNVNNFNRCEI